MKRISLFSGLAVLTLTAALIGCDPNKGQNGGAANNPATPNPTPTKAADATPDAPRTDWSFAEPFNKPRKPTGPVLIKMLTNGNDPFWDTMGQGLKAGVKEGNADPNSNWVYPQQADNNSQKASFEQQMAANADGIGVSPIEAEAFAPTIDEAIAKGVPVVTFDSDSPKSKRLAYIGTNNYEAGKAAGQEAIRLFPNGGNLVAFVGNMTADNARQRYQGFLDAVKGHNITMLQEPYQDDKDQVGRAHQNVADAITKYGDKLNGLLGLYAYNGPAIADEVQKAHLLGKVKIICFDGAAATLDDLGKGLIDATVVQKPYEFGRISAKLLTLINRKGLDAALKELDPELTKNGMKLDMATHIIDTGVTVVTPANYPAFKKDLDAKGLKST